MSQMGQFSEVDLRNREVRFDLKSVLGQFDPSGPKSSISESGAFLFDHLVSAGGGLATRPS